MRKKIIAALILGAVAISLVWHAVIRREEVNSPGGASSDGEVGVTILKGLLPGARTAAGFLEVWEALNQLLRC